LSCAHAILSNSEKRKLYDKTGELDGSDLSDEAAEWNMYFRHLFPKLTVEAIEKFSTKYKYSEEERTGIVPYLVILIILTYIYINTRTYIHIFILSAQDILQAYELRKGYLEDIMESVILAEEEDRERIVDIINAAIASGELTEYTKWQSSSSSSSIKSKPRKSISLSGKTKKKSSEINDNLLIQMISNKNRQADKFADICAKYSKENSPKNKGNKQKTKNSKNNEYEISDADFEKLRADISKKK